MGATIRTRSPSARHAAATPTASRGPQRAEAPGRIPASRPARCSSGTSGPLRSVTSTRTRPFPTLTATVTVPPAAPTGYAGHYCRTARSPAGGVIPARVTGTEHPADERAGDPRPLRPPGHRHALPDLQPSHQRTRLPRPPPPVNGKSPGPPGRMYGNARSTQRLTSSRNTRPARPVRGRPWKADGARRPS